MLQYNPLLVPKTALLKLARMLWSVMRRGRTHCAKPALDAVQFGQTYAVLVGTIDDDEDEALVAGAGFRARVTISTFPGGFGVPLNHECTRPSWTLSVQITFIFSNMQLFQTNCNGDVGKVVNVLAKEAGEEDEYCSRAKAVSPAKVVVLYHPTPKILSSANSIPS